MDCKRGYEDYGKHCFYCGDAAHYLTPVRTAETRQAFEKGITKTQIAIGCPSQRPFYLTFDLTREQIVGITQGRLEEITVEACLSGIITPKNILDYIRTHEKDIKIKMHLDKHASIGDIFSQ